MRRAGRSVLFASALLPPVPPRSELADSLLADAPAGGAPLAEGPPEFIALAFIPL